ncbi:3-hydroxyacyl-[acyl-carrier-protein] dehydratase FabZ [Alphaproteobacteria bacterium]|nr:3-hydroxyacyl-[acyl-carrier-protein] dehydratase FabZ [Alphaproteobacteria bacterium]GHT00214.1 3-hydroxyacyl-[acyl-carrier-protein] dehydratase FabZ [Alphaproteobacteria bacterium]
MELSYKEILQRLPHRYPFLLVDKVVDLVPHEKITGIKNVTFNEPMFQGHFPHDPIFPGVLIVEAMAQAAALLALVSIQPEVADDAPSIYFMTIDNVKFRKPVRPGDTLRLCVAKEQSRNTVWKVAGEAWVEHEKVAEANLMAMIQNN